MSGYHIGRPNWLDPNFYPSEECIIKGVDNDHVLFLDVGGGMGDDVANMRLDLDIVIGDFFQEQQIKGARAYFLHSVLHDWPNKQCQMNFHQLKTAMKPGYSRLLIYENVLPEQNPSWKMTALVIIMMANAGGIERIENIWKELVEASGLEVNGIWTADGNYESVIEIVRNH
ncbi:hypothetical protein G7Y89_g13017 [Cudoniella acicularis]|uniref:O-methyltransferase C-terminal domain-containing protein n=1 Tax=Cudoniella acicularis TaxID=354080 RepID=A0A8H4RAC0_9HELO|nr:hypothetical protein G7Y89_g13017 [Cudoniella acicularis]